MAKKYVDGRGVRHNPIKVNKTQAQVGKSLTVENDTMSISDLARMSQLGMDLPPRAEIQVGSIEEITDAAFDITDVEAYSRMDRVDRAIERNRLEALKDAWEGAYLTRKAEFDKVEAEKRKERNEKTADDSPEPAPDPVPQV